jgi:hypothetical protein
MTTTIYGLRNGCIALLMRTILIFLQNQCPDLNQNLRKDQFSREGDRVWDVTASFVFSTLVEKEGDYATFDTRTIPCHLMVVAATPVTCIVKLFAPVDVKLIDVVERAASVESNVANVVIVTAPAALTFTRALPVYEAVLTPVVIIELISYTNVAPDVLATVNPSSVVVVALLVVMVGVEIIDAPCEVRVPITI